MDYAATATSSLSLPPPLVHIVNAVLDAKFVLEPSTLVENAACEMSDD